MAAAQTQPKSGGGARPLLPRRARTISAVLLALLVAPEATAPGAPPPAAAAAGQARKPLAAALQGPANPGAADLFAALTEPDRAAEIEALRAIRRELTSADDPRARDAARDQVDGLLEIEERRQPDVPPALVLSSLAARIDNAILGLEQVAQAAPAATAAPGATEMPVQAALLAAFGAMAGALGIGVAAQGMLRRSLASTMESAFQELNAAFLPAQVSLQQTGLLLDRAQGGIFSAVDAAQAAVKETAAAASRLASAGADAELRLRDCMDAMELRQRSSAELAGECQTVTQNLPVVLAGAIEAMSARGLPNIDAATQTLSSAVNDIAAATALLPTVLAELQACASGLGNAAAGSYRRADVALDRLEALAAALPDVASSLAETAASLNREPAPSVAVAHVPDDASALPAKAAALDAAIDRVHDFAGLLPQITASLAEAAGQLRRDTHAASAVLANNDVAALIGAIGEAAALLGREAHGLAASAPANTAASMALNTAISELRNAAALMAEHDGQRVAALQTLVTENAAALAALPRQTELLLAAAAAAPETLQAVNAAAARLAAETQQLSTTARAHTHAAVELERLSAQLPAVTVAWADIAMRTGSDMASAAAEVRHTASSLHLCMDGQATALAALTSRADAALTAIPVEMSQLAAASASLQHHAATLEHTTRCVEVHASELSAAGDGITRAIAGHADAIDAHFHQANAGLDSAAMAMRHATSAWQEQAEQSVRATQDAGAYLAARAREAAAQPAGTATPQLAADIAVHVDRLSTVLTALEISTQRLEFANHAGAPEPDARLAAIELAVANAMDLATRLEARTEAQIASAAAVARAAADLAQAAAGDQPAPTLAWLGGFASQTRLLLQTTSNMAEAAMKGDIVGLPYDIVGQAPSVLAVIEASIEGLRGTATALAIASDSARAAA